MMQNCFFKLIKACEVLNQSLSPEIFFQVAELCLFLVEHMLKVVRVIVIFEEV